MQEKQIKTLRAKSEAELRKILFETREKVWKMKAEIVQGKVKNVREIGLLKKTIARILTVLK